MMDFNQRTRKEELLDQLDLKKEDLFVNLKELESINKLLGGHRATLIGLNKLIKDKKRKYTIVDYACGGGDTLRRIHSFAKENGFDFRLVGFDLLHDAITFSEKESIGKEIEFYQADFRDFEIEGGVDIAINSLCCHHFYDKMLLELVKKMHKDSKIGVVINDLHRHPIAYYGIALLTKLFSKSHLVKHDAKLSVLRGFTKRDWVEILDESRLKNYSIEWVWAFRHLVIINKS